MLYSLTYITLPVSCPIGTFFNVVHKTCESCERGTYQMQEGQLTCLVCPSNTSTSTHNAKSVNQCKGKIHKSPEYS